MLKKCHGATQLFSVIQKELSIKLTIIVIGDRVEPEDVVAGSLLEAASAPAVGVFVEDLAASTWLVG